MRCGKCVSGGKPQKDSTLFPKVWQRLKIHSPSFGFIASSVTVLLHPQLSNQPEDLKFPLQGILAPLFYIQNSLSVCWKKLRFEGFSFFFFFLVLKVFVYKLKWKCKSLKRNLTQKKKKKNCQLLDCHPTDWSLRCVGLLFWFSFLRQSCVYFIRCWS